MKKMCVCVETHEVTDNESSNVMSIEEKKRSLSLKPKRRKSTKNGCGITLNYVKFRTYGMLTNIQQNSVSPYHRTSWKFHKGLLIFATRIMTVFSDIIELKKYLLQEI